ncbi:hypothetical protein ACFFIS_11235 [Virgibacillus soli]|uniref:Uncharacterized protein n=1 Tax=Paracerasibacillus soli TaxID=480284 RepID=A0ABU5CRY9_9BACI|nr:hypothetical protein [Virgibacillus soli]MDY0408190.1 hypothetical protein [Virgibacillus soli]
MDKRIKEGLHAYFQDKQLFTKDLEERIMMKSKSRSKIHKGKKTFKFTPIFSLIATVVIFAGLTMFALAENQTTKPNTPNNQDEVAGVSQSDEVEQKEAIQQYKAEIEKYKTEVNKYIEENDKLNHELVELKSVNKELVTENENYMKQLKEEKTNASNELFNHTEKLLKNAGYDDGIAGVRKDLMSNPDIIPYEGVLGGTMNFYSEEDIIVLSHEWVFASFEDGHNMGFALLKYTIENGKIVKWELVDSYLWE